MRRIRTMHDVWRRGRASLPCRSIPTRRRIERGAVPPDKRTTARVWVFTREPRLTRFQKSMLVSRMKAPCVDLFEQSDALSVIAELQGAREDCIQVQARGDVLIIEAPAGPARYYTEVLLPFSVDSGSVRTSFKNGILDVELERDGGRARRRRGKAGRR